MGHFRTLRGVYSKTPLNLGVSRWNHSNTLSLGTFECCRLCRSNVSQCMVAIRGGCRVARGWHYSKSLYRVPFFYLVLACVFCYGSFLSAVLVLFFVVVFLLSLELCRCSSDTFLSRRPRTGLATTYIQCCRKTPLYQVINVAFPAEPRYLG